MVLETTGWYSYDEFVHVLARLQNPANYPYIASKISLWKTRGKVPAAVEATELLIGAVVADLQGLLSTCGLRSLYAMAVIRAVNLLLDQEQDREYARSLKLIAKACELPEYIITVRHECSHRDIPDINTLRITASDAINYVYQKYWMAQYKSIMYKLQNRDYDALSLCALLLSCQCTVLMDLSRADVDTYRCRLNYLGGNGGGSSQRKLVLLLQDPLIKSAILAAKRSILLVKRRSYMSFRRRTYHGGAVSVIMHHDTRNVDVYSLFIHQVCGLAKRLIDGCVHDAFFISVFVEFVFTHFDPSRNSLFLVILLEVLGHLPFNFILQFAAVMLDVVFELGDVLSEEGIESKEPSYIDRMATYSKFFSTPSSAYIQKRLGRTMGQSHFTEVDSCTARRRVNSWLVSLLDWAVNYEDRRSRICPLYAMLLACSTGKEEGHRMWTNAGNGLARFASAVYQLLPHSGTQMSSREKSAVVGSPRLKPQPWETDRLSHVLGLYVWLDQYHSSGIRASYCFSVLSASKKSELLDVVRKKCSGKVSGVDSLMLPGTFWDQYRWRIHHTVPRIPESACLHSRIMKTLSHLMAHSPIKLSGKNNRRFERSGRRFSDATGSGMRNSRAFLHIIAQLSTSTKHLSHRERFS